MKPRMATSVCEVSMLFKDRKPSMAVEKEAHTLNFSTLPGGGGEGGDRNGE